MRGLNIHTHTHKRNRLLGFFFFFFYILDILNLKNFFFVLIFECRVFLYSSGWGMCIPTFVDFFLFHLFFSFSLFLSFSFSFFSFLVARRVFIAFFFLRPLASRLLHPSIHSYFFFIRFFFFILVNGAIVKRYALTPPHYLSLLTMSSS